MKKPERITLSEEEVQALLGKLASCNLDAPDKKILMGVVQFYLWLQWALQESKLTVYRLRSLFGLKSERLKNLPSILAEEGNAEGTPSEEEGEAEMEDKPRGLRRFLSQTLTLLKGKKEPLKLEKAKRKGHGRLGQELYTGATLVRHEHETLHPGDACPESCGGRLYALKPKVMICLTGHSLASATKHWFERVRCALCGQIFTATSQEPLQKYDEALKASLAIAKHYAGMPFYRLQMLQKMVGVPLPNTTQWQLTESLLDDIHPVYREMERLAAQGELIGHDDTMVRILDLMRENKEKALKGEKGRTGMFTTGIVSAVGERLIHLFISGRNHSGENMQELLTKRLPGLATVIRMADALSSNTLTDEFKTILCKCLAHGRRKFYEIYAYFPGECRLVIDGLAIVYHYDAITKEQKMNPEERLAYHKEHSSSIMTALHAWMTQKLEKKEVEPNSSVGKALKYMLNHWEGLTRFLHVSGAPLDNNATERALKIPIRSRKNSLFYKTEHGALVGGMLTSIIHTCVVANENPVEYLVALQKNKKALFKAPGDWLPWTYKRTLASQIGPPVSQAAA